MTNLESAAARVPRDRIKPQKSTVGNMAPGSAGKVSLYAFVVMSDDQTLHVLTATELHPADTAEDSLVDINRSLEGEYSVDFSRHPGHQIGRELPLKAFDVRTVYTPISHVTW